MNLPSFSNIPSLSSIGEQIAEKIPDNMKTMSVTLRHMLLVSHAVPAVRVRPLVPASLELDTLKVNGETCAILQTTCFFNDDFHYSPLPKPSLDFWQMNYRVLTHQRLIDKTTNIATAPVTPRGEQGMYVFTSYLGTRASWAVQRAVASGAEYADFNVITRGQTDQGHYSNYLIDVKPGDDTPVTQIAVRTNDDLTPQPPFAKWDKMTHFLTHRLQAYAQLSVGENLILLPAEHALMNPSPAELVPVGNEVKEARFGVWEKLNLLSPTEMRRPFSVLIQPQIVFTVLAPRPVQVVEQPATTG
ncbi:MAG TPA: DUF2071 domain-containing protein [Abditibacteriaceae bacterium]|jgi:hypothetical protein